MLNNILDKVGNTPLVALKQDGNHHLNIFAKLEYYNPTGSIKDRAAFYIINSLLNKEIINQNTTIIESSSGNFGVSLSAFTKQKGLRFICVIDKNTLPVNEMLIRLQGAEVICINEPDKYGGFLLNRLKKIKEIMQNSDNIYWVNQYENPLNAHAYYISLGNEICIEAPRQQLDYVFIGVSSGGTITGISQKVKEKYPKAQVIAVDVEGSVIFGGEAHKRFIPGIGSSLRPQILSKAYIDDVIIVNEEETIDSCMELLEKYNLYVGGSSGSVYAAIKKYFKETNIFKPTNVMCVFADKGERYITTIYNSDWRNMVAQHNLKSHEVPFKAIF